MKKRLSKPTDLEYRSIIKDIVPVDDLDIEFKVVLYGRAGTGKTTITSTFPKPLLIIDCKETGTDSVRDVKGIDVLRAKSWDQIDKIYWYLRKEGSKKYKSVSIDTLSNVQDFSIRKTLEDLGEPLEEGKLGGWGTMTKRAWGSVSSDLKSLVHNFKELPMNVAFIAHDRVSREDEEDEDSGITPNVGPRLMPSVASVVNAAVGTIGNTFILERNRTIKIGKKIVKKRDIQYGLRIGPHAYYTTKIRKPKSVIVPAVMIDPTYEKIIALIEGDNED